MKLKRLLSLMLVVLLLIGMSPVTYAARDTAKIILEKIKVKVEVEEKTIVFVDYTELEDLGDPKVDVSRAKAFVDNASIVRADFASEGSDLSALEITGLADGETTVWIKVGRFYSSLMVTVGRGAKTPEQIKREEEAKKAEEEAIAKDDSQLGKDLTEALKKSTKKDVSLNTTAKKDPAISVITMKALTAKASQEKKRLTVRVDSHGSDGKVQAQLYFNPAGLTVLKSDFKTGVSVNTSRKASLGADYIASVQCEHTGTFNTFVEIAARVGSIKEKDLEKISVYNVGKDGKMKKIEEPTCSVDKNGFLHFFTRDGGEIVIMKG